MYVCGGYGLNRYKNHQGVYSAREHIDKLTEEWEFEEGIGYILKQIVCAVRGTRM